ncbi:MAG: hypothetical protein WC736_16580, partial [Gallionella sp.]
MYLSPACADPVVIADDFSRTESGSLGSNWTDPGNAFHINANTSQATNRVAWSGTKITFYNGADVGTASFSVQANLNTTGTEPTRFVGLCFNVIDANNYYFAQVRKSGGLVQVMKVVNGATPVKIIPDFSTGWTGGGLMKISYDGDGFYNISIGGTTRVFTDSAPHIGGSVGLAFSYVFIGAGAVWSNFTMTSWSSPVTISDDFSRTVSGGLGPKWVDSGSVYHITGNAAKAVNGAASNEVKVAFCNGVDVGSAAFSLQANLNTADTVNTRYVGLCFNVLDANNFCFAQVRKLGGLVQVMKVVNGATPVRVIPDFSSDWTGGGLMRISSDGAGSYTITVGSTSVHFTDSVPLLGGSAGLAFSYVFIGSGAIWTNFSLTYVCPQEHQVIYRNAFDPSGSLVNWTGYGYNSTAQSLVLNGNSIIAYSMPATDIAKARGCLLIASGNYTTNVPTLG